MARGRRQHHTFAEKVSALSSRPSILSDEEKEVYLMPDENLESVNASVLLSTSKSMILAMNTNAEYQHNMRSRLSSLRVAETPVDSDNVDDLF